LLKNIIKKGGDYLFLDEVHKYPNWSQELKNIYDNLPKLKVVFTSSSALDIYKGSHDLSRRAMVYNLPGLSFREFIELKYQFSFEVIGLEQILEGKNTQVFHILEKIKPLKLLDEYLQNGYYPFFVEADKNYLARLINIVNQVLENDLPTIYHIDFYSVLKIKKMLAVLSRIVPYKPNIQKLVSQSGTTRDSLLKFLFYLEKAEIVNWLTKDTFGINYLNKPDKLYLNNTNLMYALASEKPNIGNIRETFFFNQLRVNHKVSYPENGDFLIDDKYLFEIGGQNKSQKQIDGIENAFIAADGIEYSVGNKIPLWLFGFMY
jgi:predicted AAA+ superfamily ATPase